jgi:hypothetical protein|tara:strand:+ start:2576 stop:2755 length:180 start_codon:yes stop_codon:yes gene_type:complete
MPKSKHRKNHKSKVQSFKQSVTHSKNREIKEYQQKLKEAKDSSENSKKETFEQPKRITL